ncbi:MAG: hypothetical protein ACOC0C_05570 [Bacteroidota bacterium]
MLNNPALDVAIGLIFIYALFSLLATTITELISAWLNFRGEFLKKGIQRMLDDDSGVSIVDNPAAYHEPSNDHSKKHKKQPRFSRLFFDRAEIKYLGKKRLFRKGNNFPSYIKARTFAKAFLNVLEKAKQTHQDLVGLRESLDEKIPTQEFIRDLIEESNYNIERFKALAERWFNETMERVAGWYKRRVQLVSFIVGLILAFSMNLDTLTIGKKLSTDKEARLAMLEAASVVSEGNPVTTTNDTTFYGRIDELNARIDTILTDVEEAESILQLAPPENFKLMGTGASKASWLYVLGCLLTAIALSVGSPFWFDLLNRLVKVRSSGVQEKAPSQQSKNKPVG